jgi:hypothetical protein
MRSCTSGAPSAVPAAAQYGTVRRLARVLVWSQAVPLEQGMRVPLVAHCKSDMTPFTRSACPLKGTGLRVH